MHDNLPRAGPTSGRSYCNIATGSPVAIVSESLRRLLGGFPDNKGMAPCAGGTVPREHGEGSDSTSGAARICCRPQMAALLAWGTLTLEVGILTTMARKPTKTLTTKVPQSLLVRAARCARHMDLSLAEFVRRCVEGRVNQIEASRGK